MLWSRSNLDRLRFMRPTPEKKLFNRNLNKKYSVSIFSFNLCKNYHVLTKIIRIVAKYLNTGNKRIVYKFYFMGNSPELSVADPDPHGSALNKASRIRIQEVNKPRKCTSSAGKYRTGRSKVRNLF